MIEKFANGNINQRSFSKTNPWPAVAGNGSVVHTQDSWGPPGTCRPQMGPMLAHEPCYQGSRQIALYFLFGVSTVVTYIICKENDRGHTE